ncbi:MAG TPA: hypothetical protein VME69_01140 [Methylocella sp.]|nr:hypothetical protein [Methylocella sp.]
MKKAIRFCESRIKLRYLCPSALSVRTELFERQEIAQDQEVGANSRHKSLAIFAEFALERDEQKCEAVLRAHPAPNYEIRLPRAPAGCESGLLIISITAGRRSFPQSSTTQKMSIVAICRMSGSPLFRAGLGVSPQFEP